jgi:YfiH family protein
MNNESPDMFFDNFSHVIALASHRNHGNMKVISGSGARERRKNRIKFLKFLPFGGKIIMAGIVHGTKVQFVKSASSPIVKGVDALMAYKKFNLFLGLTFADCPPVYFHDPVADGIAIAHCSYKNVSRNFPLKVVKKMMDYGSRREDIKIVIGPGICASCYEFGEKDAFQYFGEYSRFIYESPVSGKCKLDLRSIIKCQLESAGILDIKESPDCTCCNKNIYFSARGEKMKPGKIQAGLAVIGIKKIKDFSRGKHQA